MFKEGKDSNIEAVRRGTGLHFKKKKINCIEPSRWEGVGLGRRGKES